MIELRLAARRGRRGRAAPRRGGDRGGASRRHGGHPPRAHGGRGPRGDGGRAHGARDELRLPVDRHAARRDPAQRALRPRARATAICCWPTSAPRPRRLGRRRHAHLAGLRPLLAHAARLLRGRAGGAAAGDRGGRRPARATATSTCSPARRWRRAWSISASCAAIRSRWRPTAWSRCCSRTASDICSGSTCTTWKTSAIAPATRRGASARRSSACARSASTAISCPAWRSPSSPASTRSPSILDDPALTRVAGDRLDRKKLAAFADVRGIRIEDDVLVTETGREVLTEAIPKSIAAVESAVGQTPGA